MKNTLLLVSIWLKFQSANAQITFQRTYGGLSHEYGNFIQQTTDFGYIITGQAASFSNVATDVYLIKTDSSGDTLWTKDFNIDYDEYGYSVEQTTDGGYIVAGVTYSFNLMTSKVYAIKTDAYGNLLWMKTYGGTGAHGGYSVHQTTDSGFIMAGWKLTTGPPANDVYLIKTDLSGDTLWTKTYGGNLNELGYSVEQTSDDGYIICGSTTSFGAGIKDVYLVKTDSIGNLLWSKSYGGTGNEEGRFVQQTTDGGYIITGFTDSFGAGNNDTYLVKTDSIGNLLWSKTFGGLYGDQGYCVRQTTNGDYIVSGNITINPGNSDYFIIKTNPVGDTLWAKSIGGTVTEVSFSIQQTFDGGFIISGMTGSFGAGGADVYLIKTDSNVNIMCNESNNATVTSPSTQSTNPATLVSSYGSVFPTIPSLIRSGGQPNMICPAGINEIIANNSFFIFPNPSAGNFIIALEETITKGNVEIFNILEKNIFMETISNESKKEIKLNNISAGIYFVKVFDGEKSYCKKLIVEQY